MTKRLILMRHAKSSWDSPFGGRSPTASERSRTTIGQGKLGDWLRDHDYLPDQVLSSSSTRTRETCAGLDLEADKRFLDGLYHAGAGQMLEILKQANGELRPDAWATIRGSRGLHRSSWTCRRITPRFNDYPTCATLVVDFPVSTWRDLRKGTGKAIDFVIPRELTGS